MLSIIIKIIDFSRKITITSPVLLVSFYIKFVVNFGKFPENFLWETFFFEKNVGNFFGNFGKIFPEFREIYPRNCRELLPTYTRLHTGKTKYPQIFPGETSGEILEKFPEKFRRNFRKKWEIFFRNFRKKFPTFFFNRKVYLLKYIKYNYKNNWF